MKNCRYIKTDGTKCGAYSVKDDDYCFAHSEKHKQDHQDAVMVGGKSLKRSYTDKEAILVRKNEDAVYLIEQVINEVRANQISVKMASVLAILINLALKAIPSALKDKHTEREVRLFKKGELDMGGHYEVLEGTIRIK